MQAPITGNRKRRVILTGAALFSLSAAQRYAALAQTPYANGWDGYFYLVQLKSWVETGRMHSPEASLVYPYLRLIYWFTSDYIIALKLGAAVLAGLFTWAVFAVADREAAAVPNETAYRADAGIFIAAVSVFSPQLTYFTAQFPKNLLGAVLLVAFIGSLPPMHGAVLHKPVKSWALPAIVLIINYFGHRLTFSLALVYLACRFVFEFREQEPERRRAYLRILAWVVPAGAGAVLIAGAFLPGLFHFIDFGRLSGVFSPAAQFAPWSFISRFGRERLSGWWLTEIAVATACWGYMVIRLMIRSPLLSRSGLHYPLLCLCSLMLFPFLEWSFTGIAYRLFLVFVLLAPLLLIDLPFTGKRRTGVIFAAFLLASSFFSRKSYQPSLHDPDYNLFSKATTNARRYLSDKSPELIIAHNALAEFYTFSTGTDAMPWLPEYRVDSARLWRIAADVPLQTVRYYAGAGGEEAVRPLGYPYILLPEYVWNAAIDRAKRENDEAFLADARGWRNPSQIRPAWLLHRKRKF